MGINSTKHSNSQTSNTQSLILPLLLSRLHSFQVQAERPRPPRMPPPAIQLFLPSTQQSYLRSPRLSATIARFNLLTQRMPSYSPSKGNGTLLTFWRAPATAGISSTTSHVDMPSPRQTYRDQPAASVAPHASSYPTTSHSKP